MRKSQKILLGIFLTGVFLCGVGSGVAIGEFTSMAYLGERQLGEDMQVTENFDFAFDPAEGDIKVQRPRFVYRGKTQVVLEEDPKVPENTVRFETTYIPECADLFVEFEEELIDDVNEPETEERRTQRTIWLDRRYYDCFPVIVREKDAIIEDLKNHSFASYQMHPIYEIVVKVNPDTAELVQFED